MGHVTADVLAGGPVELGTAVLAGGPVELGTAVLAGGPVEVGTAGTLATSLGPPPAGRSDNGGTRAGTVPSPEFGVLAAEPEGEPACVPDEVEPDWPSAEPAYAGKPTVEAALLGIVAATISRPMTTAKRGTLRAASPVATLTTTGPRS